MSKRIDLTEQKFGKLTVISEAERINGSIAWLCLCDCGNYLTTKSKYLKNGDTKSCGCITIENRHHFAKLMITARTQFTPIIASARNVWRDNYYELSFEDFYKLSQLNCHYCDNLPNNSKSLKTCRNRSLLSIENSVFIYNGLDRVDSFKSHTMDNVVPCCWICNRAKSNRTYDQFIMHIDNLVKNKLNRIDFDQYRETYKIIDKDKLSNSTFKSSVKAKFKSGKSGYSDGDLSLEQFYQLSQLNCYYCGTEPSNTSIAGANNKQSSETARQNAKYVYSGLDRLDSLIVHNYDNIIPSCKYCNYAKSSLSLTEFYEWIDKLEMKKANHF